MTVQQDEDGYPIDIDPEDKYYAIGFKAGQIHERERILEALPEMKSLHADTSQYGVAEMAGWNLAIEAVKQAIEGGEK